MSHISFFMLAMGAASVHLAPAMAQSAAQEAHDASPNVPPNVPPKAAKASEATLPAVHVTAPVAVQTATGPIPLDQKSRTGSLLGLSVRETPGAITVVDRALMETIGAEDTQSALRAVPGVTAHDAPGNPTVVFRGFSAGSLAQLFNGIQVQYSVAARPVDAWIYDRVEALGGPSGFLYGAGAVGGAVNYISKLAQQRDFSQARVRLGSQHLREASFGFNRRLGSDENSARVRHDFRLDVNHRQNHGWTEGTRRQATELAASLLTDFGRGLTHTLAYEYQHERVERPYWGTPLLNPVTGTARIDEATRRLNYNSRDGHYGQRVQWLRSLTQYQVTPALTVKNTFYAYDALRNYRNVEGYQFNADNTAVIRNSALLQRHDQRLLGNRIDATYSGELAGRESQWAFGADFSANRQTRYPLSLPGTVSTVNPYQFETERFWDIPGMEAIYSPDRTVRLRTAAFYFENRTRIGERLHLLTGLRHDRIRMSLSNHRAITAASPAHYSRHYNSTAGRLGLMWEPAPGLNTYIQYATAADPPAGSLTTATFANAITNTNLTRGRQVEAGLKSEFWEGKASATVAVFHITRKNIATQDPANPSNTLLVGQQSARGMEVSAGAQLGKQFSLLGNVAYVKSQYDEFTQGGISLAGRTPTGIPRVVANLWANYQVTPQFTVGAGLRKVGSAYANAANTIRMPGHVLLDLSATWQVGKDMQLNARVRNATDKLYMLSSGTTSAYLGAPRSVDVALNIQF